MEVVKCKYCSHKITRDDFLCNYCGRLTTSLNAFDTAKEMKTSFVELNNKVNSLRGIIKSQKIPADDQRNQVLGSLSHMIAWCVLQLGFYDQFARRPTDPIPKWVRSVNPTITNEGMIEFLSNYDNINRRSFLTNFLFQIEVFLEELNKILITPTDDQGFKFLVKYVIKELKLKNPDNETYRVLYFPAMVRNAMHMNGIHTKEDDNGRIDGILFKFKKNHIVNYGSWMHTYFFCDKILDVIGDILKLDYLKGKRMPRTDFDYEDELKKEKGSDLNPENS